MDPLEFIGLLCLIAFLALFVIFYLARKDRDDLD